MNRFTVTMGKLTGSGTQSIVASNTGYKIAYNGIDQRTRVDSSRSVETYQYDSNGHLTKTLSFAAGTTNTGNENDANYRATRSNNNQGVVSCPLSV